MIKRTVVDQIEITRDGTIGVRLAKEVVDDDGSVLSREWHRTVLPPGHDIDKQIAEVNAHLEMLKCAKVNVSEVKRIRDVAPVVWTKAVKDAFAAKLVRPQ